MLRERLGSDLELRNWVAALRCTKCRRFKHLPFSYDGGHIVCRSCVETLSWNHVEEASSGDALAATSASHESTSLARAIDPEGSCVATRGLLNFEGKMVNMVQIGLGTNTTFIQNLAGADEDAGYQN